MRIALLVSLIVASGLSWPTDGIAQSTEDATGQAASAQPVAAQVLSSPVPLPRSIPQEAPPDPAANETTVTVVTPGEDEPVKVVFKDETTSDGSAQVRRLNPNDASIQQERDSRFKQAPKRPQAASVDPGTLRGRAVPIRAPRTELTRGASLRQLDKMTGQTQTYGVAVGDVVQVARLRIRLDACRAPADGESRGTMAFMKIWDTKYPDDGPVFTGWMFSDSPALSALDHPRYDLWVITCTTSDG